jgi:hypothetical protein
MDVGMSDLSTSIAILAEASLPSVVLPVAVSMYRRLEASGGTFTEN